jgi:hypothetical protein
VRSSAQAKDYGLINPTARATDGFVGLEAVAWHEISEVMGRIGMEGQHFNGKATYTPLDLFNFVSKGVLASLAEQRLLLA